MKLTDQAVRAAEPQAKGPFRILDDDNLYLVVYPTGRKSFEYRYVDKGRLRVLILGTYGARDGELTLKAARLKRDGVRAMRVQGGDPVAASKIEAQRQQQELAQLRAANAAAKAQARAERARAEMESLTLRKVADAWIADTRPLWSEAHAEQVEQSLRDHVYSEIGGRSIASIESADVLRVLDGMLTKGMVETTRRVRQRLDAVFEYAGVHHKVGNPVAAAKRIITARMKRASEANPEASFPCVPMDEVPQLLAAMSAYVGTRVTRSLLWFVALTACRTGEARFATWGEFNLADAVWMIPASRMKAGREHVVALAPAVVTMLHSLKAHNRPTSPFVFPHPRRDDRPASEAAILYALAALGYKDRMTGHGFRQMFSTLANESGLWRPDVIEMALAHKESDAVRAAYNKAQYTAERRRLMEWYADELARLRDSVQREAA